MEGNMLHSGGAGEHFVDEPIDVRTTTSTETFSEAEALAKQGVSTVDDLRKESIEGEKDDHHFVVSDCLASCEENMQLSVCSESYEESSSTPVADKSEKQDTLELCNNFNDSLSNTHIVKSYTPVKGTVRAGEDETKACAENPVPELSVEATHEVLSVDSFKASDVSGCKDMLSDGVTCEERVSGFGNEDFKTGCSDSGAMSEELKATNVEHNKEPFTSQRENNSSLSEGLSPVPGIDDEVQKDETIESKSDVEVNKGACLQSSIDCNLVPSDTKAKSSTESTIDHSISKTPEEANFFEPAGNVTELVMSQETHDSYLDNAPKRKGVTKTKVALNKLQDTTLEMKSQEDDICRALKVPTCVLDRVEFSEAVHGDNNTVEEECTTVVVEECVLAAEKTIAVDASNICSSPLPSLEATRSLVPQSSSSTETKNHRISFKTEANPLAQTENEAASCTGQLRHGYSINKDGGSGADSTAGSGWKLQATDCWISTVDANGSAGDEDCSPACVKPSSQQRKKINIHHQFVREIVKIQHDREQYDKDQVERQYQAQQTAGLAQQGGKTSYIKEYKTNLVEKRQLRTDSSKQRGSNDRGPDRRMKESQQKHSTRNRKALHPQSMNWSPQLRDAPCESNEQGRPPFSQGEDSSGAKHGKTGRGKHLLSLSICRPVVAQDSLAAGSHEQNNLGERVFFNRHSAAYMMNNSSPDSSTSSVSDPHFPFVGSPNSGKDEGTLTVTRGTSGERYVHYIESQAEQSTPGMGIKVTFDTQKKLRHIEFSDDSDLTRGQKQNEQMSMGSFDSSSGFGSSKSPAISNPFGDLTSLLGTSPAISKRQAGFGETLYRGNDTYFSQADKSNLSQTGCSSISFQVRGKADKGFDNSVEGRGMFSEQAGNNASVHKSSSWLQKSPSPPIHFRSSVGHSGQSTYIDRSKRSEEHVGDVRMPSSLLHSSPASSRKAASLGTSYTREQAVAEPFDSPYRKEQSTDDSDNLSMNQQASFQIPPLNLSRTLTDFKGKQKVATGADGGKNKWESQSRKSVKGPCLPSQAMRKDLNMPQVMFSSPVYQASGNSQPDFQGSSRRWNAVEDCTGSEDNFKESLKRSQSDPTRKSSTQNPQPQPSPLPSEGSAFCTSPLLGKWGDIVDDLPDTYDYLQTEDEGGREGCSASPLHRADSHNDAGFLRAASFKASKLTCKDTNWDKGSRYHGGKEGDGKQKNKAFSEVYSSNETPVRKSVWERLGPQNNYKESILGPPPKAFDNKGVLKSSPDSLTLKMPTLTKCGVLDFGLHASPQVSHGAHPHFSSMLHGSGASINDEGLEVVVQAYTDMKQRRSKRELYVPRRGL